jgi:hypothetical protein
MQMAHTQVSYISLCPTHICCIQDLSSIHKICTSRVCVCMCTCHDVHRCGHSEGVMSYLNLDMIFIPEIILILYLA